MLGSTRSSYFGSGRSFPSLLSIARGSYGFGYDSTSGNLASLTSPDGGALSFEYDGSLLTRLEAAGDVAASIAWTYDPDLAVTTETVECGGGGSLACEPLTFGYDQDRLLTAAGALTLARDPQNGRLTGTEAGIITDTWTYNALGEPEQYTARSGGAVIFDQQFTRDDAGRITRKIETVDGTITTYEYGYDDAGHLRDVTRNGALAGHYEYDANGNRILRSAPLVTETGNFDDQDRCASYGGATYTYAASGELEAKTDATGTTQYQYDELGNLLHVHLPTGEAIDYVIDASNRRVGRKAGGLLEERLIYSDALRPAAQLDGDGNVTARFVYGTRSNVPDLIIKGDTTYRVLTDHLGSPRLVVDTDTGDVMQQIEYDEFGNVLADSNPGFQPFGFAGGLYDHGTRLVRFGARDYDATTGRWTAKDPIRFGGGTANLYGYGMNDPVNLTDSSGLAPIEGVQGVEFKATGYLFNPFAAGSIGVAFTWDGVYIKVSQGFALSPSVKAVALLQRPKKGESDTVTIGAYGCAVGFNPRAPEFKTIGAGSPSFSYMHTYESFGPYHPVDATVELAKEVFGPAVQAAIDYLSKPEGIADPVTGDPYE